MVCIELEVKAENDKSFVLAKYSDTNEVDDALSQCGTLFGLCFPNKDFKILHVPILRSENEFGYIALDVCDAEDLPRYVQSSVCKVKGRRGWVYDEHGARRRDYLFRFEFQENFRSRNQLSFMPATGRA